MRNLFQGGTLMVRLLIIGNDSLTAQYVKLLHKQTSVKIIAVIHNDVNTPWMQKIKDLHIRTDHCYQANLYAQANYIVMPVENGDLLNVLKNEQNIHKRLETITDKPLNDIVLNNHYMLHSFFNVVEDGIIIINQQATIQFINPMARDILGLNEPNYIGTHIKEIIPNSRLPNVLQSQQKQLHKKMQLKNGKDVITNAFPLTNEANHLIGAFAMFKEEKDVIQLAEENTNLNQIQSTLKAIIDSSDEAISVVDEDGKGLIINKAYTNLTGFTEQEIIGRPADVDISEGESMHMQVLKTRRPVTGATMKVGPHDKEVKVNVTPIIVNGKLKGSVAVIHDVSNENKLKSDLRIAKQIIRNLESTYTFDDIIFQSEEMSLAIEQAKLAAKSEINILLKGELGTGKELFANAIHNESDRKYNKFIRIHCANYDENVLKKKIFGYEERNDHNEIISVKKGVLEEANLGTVFLDEVSSLPTSVQEALLHVLQHSKMKRVGSNDFIPIDIRIIASTSENVDSLISNGSFNKTLYQLLNRLLIAIPPLQERLHDLPHLVNHFIAKVNQLYGRTVKQMDDQALKILKKYDWPHNIRELENVMHQTIMLMKLTETIILEEHLPTVIQEHSEQNDKLKDDQMPSLQEAVDQFEKQFIRRIYEKNKYNKTKTAKQLKISVRNLYYKIEKYELDNE